ncbi:hypothetical protein BDV06DRAFT_183873 [Aspergillus oleicola]
MLSTLNSHSRMAPCSNWRQKRQSLRCEQVTPKCCRTRHLGGVCGLCSVSAPGWVVLIVGPDSGSWTLQKARTAKHSLV